MPTVDLSTYHQANGTTSDGSKFDNMIDAVQAALNGLDNNNIVAAAGLGITKIADPGAGKVIGSGGSAAAAVFPPGYELGTTAWSGTTSITGTASGAATTVVTAPAITFDGAPVIVEFQAAWYKVGTTSINVGLYLDGAFLGRIGFAQAGFTPAGLSGARVTPAAGSHTYSVRAFVDAGTGEVGADVSLPGFIRVTKV